VKIAESDHPALTKIKRLSETANGFRETSMWTGGHSRGKSPSKASWTLLHSLRGLPAIRDLRFLRSLLNRYATQHINQRYALHQVLASSSSTPRKATTRGHHVRGRSCLLTTSAHGSAAARTVSAKTAQSSHPAEREIVTECSDWPGL